MTSARKLKSEEGFTLIETMVALAMFLVICGTMFGLLNVSQARYHTESQVLSSFQQARLGVDQIVRDVDDSGYPPQNQFSTTPTQPDYETITPVAWSPNYPGTPCLIGTAGGGTCATPSDFDVILEENAEGTGVQWIRYQLQGTTLYRGVVLKTAGTDPAVATAGAMLPYVTNVMNNASATQIAQFTAFYPSMFPGGIPQPIFQYYCDTSSGPMLCQNAGTSNSPMNVRDVEITLIVKTPQIDAQTGAPRLVELNGRGHRINPNQ